MAVKIVTDSVADLPSELASQLGIAVVPLLVRWGEETYRDGIDLSAEQFYERLRHSHIPPVTSLPPPQVFAEAYDGIAEGTSGILAITVSSRLSGTFGVARQSVGLMKKKCRVEVLDSGWGAMAEGFVAMKAAQVARSGAGLDEVKEVAHKTMTRADLLATFDTLEYLKRGGCIGKAQAFLGSLLKVNPLITLRDGVVEPVARARTRAGALERLYKFVMSYSGIEELAIEDAACPNAADSLARRFSSKFPAERIIRSRMTPVIGTHTGPGFIMVSVLGDKG